MGNFVFFKKANKKNVVNDTAKVADSNDELTLAKQEILELKDLLLRKNAEFENFRKRKAKELQDIRFSSKCSTIDEFLTTYDHFQMAMKSVENGDNIEVVKQGMSMIFVEFARTFEGLGVEQIDATGKKFDPSIHEAISEQASEEVESGIVLQQWKYGYRIGEKLLRPATVVVSSGPATVETPEDTTIDTVVED